MQHVSIHLTVWSVHAHCCLLISVFCFEAMESVRDSLKCDVVLKDHIKRGGMYNWFCQIWSRIWEATDVYKSLSALLFSSYPVYICLLSHFCLLVSCEHFILYSARIAHPPVSIFNITTNLCHHNQWFSTWPNLQTTKTVGWAKTNTLFVSRSTAQIIQFKCNYH
jgi:hypothetical protein